MNGGGRRPNKSLAAENEGASSSQGRKLVEGETQNDEQLTRLHAQVSTLKNITIEIGQEVREQNRLLDGMGLDFDKAGSLLSQTMKQLGALTQSERGRNYLFYTALIFVVVFGIFFLRALF